MTQEDDHICIFQLDEELILQNYRVMNDKKKWSDKIPLKKSETPVNPNAKLIKTQPQKIIVGFYVSFESER